MPANPERGEIDIKLGEYAFVMRPTYGAQAEIEAVTGQKMVPLARSFARGDYGIDDVTAVITAAIRAGGEKDANTKAVGDMVAAAGLASKDVIHPVMEFFKAALQGYGKDAKAGEVKATERK